jgi:hypothetical protein
MTLRYFLLTAPVLGASWGPSEAGAAQKDTDSGASFTKYGYLLPPQNTAYDPDRALSCCLTSCVDDEGCRDGCHMWLKQSSLNFESDQWWNGLEKKCERDCVRRQHYGNQKSLLLPAGSVKAKPWWETHHLTNDVPKCNVGCNHFRACMDVFLNEPKPSIHWHRLFD